MFYKSVYEQRMTRQLPSMSHCVRRERWTSVRMRDFRSTERFTGDIERFMADWMVQFKDYLFPFPVFLCFVSLLNYAINNLLKCETERLEYIHAEWE